MSVRATLVSDSKYVGIKIANIYLVFFYGLENLIFNFWFFP